MKKFSSKNILKLRDSSDYKDMSAVLTLIADIATDLNMKVEAARVAIAVLITSTRHNCHQAHN